MNHELLNRLKYAHEHLFRMQTYIEAKNATVLSANLLLLANIDKILTSNGSVKLLLIVLFVCGFVSSVFAVRSFFPNVRGAQDTSSVIFFGDTQALDCGQALLQNIKSGGAWPDETTDLANQIAIVSRIVAVKTNNFAHALIWFAIAATIFMSAIFVQNLIGK